MANHVETQESQPEALRVHEAARRLGLAPRTLYRAIQRGEVPVIRVGRCILVPLPWLQRRLDPEGTDG